MPTSSQQLREAIDELNAVAPPGDELPGIVDMVPGTARWTIQQAGVGRYSLRIEYRNQNGNMIAAIPQSEVVGFSDSVLTAIRFAISVAKPGRYHWVAVR